MSDVSLSKRENMIYLIRGQKVMVDSDLAQLYGVLTKNLNKAVGRNKDRFPGDFMFQLTEEEAESLRFQIGTSKVGRGGRRYLPYVFTEGGVAMLSSVLTSNEAARVNISIIRTFIRLRSFLAMENSLPEKLNKLESGTNKLFKIVFERLDNIEAVVDSKLPKRKKNIGLN
jgi:hypothetical protein